MTAVAVIAGLCAGLVQGGPLAVLGEGGAAVALPGALAAGWAAVRGAREAVAVVFAAAAVLGALSEASVGLYALALMPAAAAGVIAGLGTPARRTRTARATLAGLVGATLYLSLLAVVAGGPPRTAGILWGFAASGVLTASTTLVLFPWRPPDRRLFA